MIVYQVAEGSGGELWERACETRWTELAEVEAGVRNLCVCVLRQAHSTPTCRRSFRRCASPCCTRTSARLQTRPTRRPTGGRHCCPVVAPLSACLSWLSEHTAPEVSECPAPPERLPPCQRLLAVERAWQLVRAICCRAVLRRYERVRQYFREDAKQRGGTRVVPLAYASSKLKRRSLLSQ